MGGSHSTTELPIRFVLTQVLDVNIEDHVKLAFRERFLCRDDVSEQSQLNSGSRLQRE